jgi:hypothetical protein
MVTAELAISLKFCRPPDPSPNAVLFRARAHFTQRARPTRFWPPRAVLCRVMSTQDLHATPLCWQPPQAQTEVLRTWLVGRLRWVLALLLSCKTLGALVSLLRAE